VNGAAGRSRGPVEDDPMTPEECCTREDIRREIDRVDRELVDLFAARFGYIRRMSEIKQDPAEALVVSRVNDVLAKVSGLAEEKGLDPDLLSDLWSRLMDWNIAWEEKAIAARRDASAAGAAH
jgi:isochorismate pyruvate lyase